MLKRIFCSVSPQTPMWGFLYIPAKRYIPESYVNRGVIRKRPPWGTEAFSVFREM
jgi:hypothetical protein